MAKPLYELTDEEAEILKLSASDPNIFFDYWFRKEGASKGWQLDANFDEDAKWQERFCMAKENFIVAICGIATGKTVGVVLSACYHATLLESFRFMNIAREVWQSKVGRDAILEHAENTPFSKLIYESPIKPYITVGVGWTYKGMVHRSNLGFMSLGEKKDATNILTWRGDWVNIEQAERIDGLADIVGRLSTRTTGRTAAGREYMGRLSLIANPDENPELWQMQDIAEHDKEEGLVFNVNTESNHNVSERQVQAIVKKMLDSDDVEHYLTGKRPQGKGIYFSKESVALGESEMLSKKLIQEHKDGKAILEKEKTLGVWHFEREPDFGKMYILMGDPGIGNPPSRNTPTLMLWDVTHAPNVATLDAFWWGFGNNSILPFNDMLFYLIKKYRPFVAGTDSTGPQKNTAEILNVESFPPGHDYSVDFLMPMGFAGNMKMTYLICGRSSLAKGQFIWPSICTAIGAQLRTYDPIKDKESSKLPQDIVSTFTMAAYEVRKHYGEGDELDVESIRKHGKPSPKILRKIRGASVRSTRTATQNNVRKIPTRR